MILVTGATGHLGGSVIRQLLRHLPATEIAGLTRDAAKGESLRQAGIGLRTGSYDDTASLDRAMKGIRQVLLISGGDAPNGLEQHRNVVDAARQNGVEGIAYTSRSLKDRATLENGLMLRHFETEDYIRESGMGYIIFQNSLYMDTIPQFVGNGVAETGIGLPAGGGKTAFALRREQGEAMANVLAAGAFRNQTYRFTGGGAWTFGDVATALTGVLGTEIPYRPVEAPVFEAGLLERGLPPVLAQRILDFIADIRNDQESSVYPDMEIALGRKPASLEDGLREIYGT